MWKEFKEFISKGNVMDMAVGVIIGNAFAAIVSSFTSSIIQPILSLIGGAEVHGTIPIGNSGQAIDYGSFLTAVINFFIVAIILFLMVKAFNTAEKENKKALEKISSKITIGDKINKITGHKGKKEEVKEEKTEPEIKLCPYCLSEIPYRATRCSHCTSQLEKVEDSAADNKE